MEVIVGTGALHDRLLAAACRGRGLDVETLPPPDERALAVGRALLPRGHPCTVAFLAGAMVLHARATAAPARYLTPGDRCGAYATDLARALRDAGHPEARVDAPAPERAEAWWGSLCQRARAPLWPAVRDALVSGDVLTDAELQLLSRGEPEDRVRAWADASARALTHALERAEDTVSALARCAEGLPTPRRARATGPRVRVTGELLPSLTEGATGAGLLRWMAARGAEVEAPRACEWALYWAWRARGGELHPALREALASAWRRHSGALGLPAREPVDVPAWADAAAVWLPVSLSSGAGFTELAVYLAMVEARRADLVVSLKPFASILSSSVSDGVLHALSRERSVAFLALELQGDGDTQLRSRLALALDLAKDS